MHVSYDGSFSTDTKQHETLPPGVLLELVHSSGVVTVSEVAGSTKLQVISTMKSLIHDRGPKQSSNGSPWIGPVEGVGDVKEIFADGTIIIRNQTTVRTPGGVISLKRSGYQVEITIASTSTVHLPKPPDFPVQTKKRKRPCDSPSSSSMSTSAARCELSNALSQLADDVETSAHVRCVICIYIFKNITLYIICIYIYIICIYIYIYIYIFP